MNSATAISCPVSERNRVTLVATHGSRPSSRFWRSLRNGATTIAVLVAVYALLGFLILPALLKPRLEDGLSERTQRHATLGRLEFNPFTFHARLSDFALSDRDPRRPFVGFATLDLDVSPASLRYRAPVLDAVRLRKPRLDLARNDDGSSSVEDLVTRPSPDAPARFSLNNIEIEDGTITLDDRAHRRRLVVSNLGIGLPFVSSLPHDATIRVTPHVEGMLDGTPFALNANASSPFLDRREATLDLDFDALPLARYAEYFALPDGLRLTDGTLTTRLTLAFVTEKDVAQRLLLAGDARVEKLALTRNDGSRFAGADRIELALGKLDWVARTAVIDRLHIDAPEVQLRRLQDGSLELPVAAKPEPGTSPPGQPWQFTLAQARIDNGTLHLADASVAPPFATTWSGIALTAKALASNGPPGNVELAFDGDDGAHDSMRGELDIANAAFRGHAAITKLDLPRLHAYYASALNADVRGGTVDVDADFDAAMKSTPFALTLTKGSVSLRGIEVALRDERDPFLRIANLGLAGVALDAQKRSVTIDEGQWRGGSVRVLRLADGTLALERVVRASGEPSGRSAPGAPSATPGGDGWNVIARRLSADGVVAYVEDRVPKPTVKLRLVDLRVDVDNVGNAATGVVGLDVAARIGAAGRAHVHGKLDRAPLRADLAIDARGVDVVPFKPYFESRTNVVVTRGAASTRGRLVYAVNDKGAARASFRGDVTISNFGALDRTTSQDLLRFATLKLGGVDTTTDPFHVNIATIGLDRFYARAILGADAKLNLKEMIVPSPAVQPPRSTVTTAGAVTTNELPPPVTGEALPVSIGRIELSNGEVQYSDFFVQPNYNAHLTDVSGSVTAMSATQAGDVQFGGRVEGTAPVDLRGTLNPFSSQLQLDLTGKANDVDLPPLTPYSVKYAGYGIEKGKLSLEVHYKIEDRKLAATNRLKLDQLTFGEHVDTPTATKLPVLLAVSLLKDRNGVINLDLPIQGTLDDPQFSVWRVVVQIFVNLVTKAVTAPFALLASIGGSGGEQLAHVEFAPGRADLSPAATEKLRTLAKALNDRPALKLDAAGRAIPDRDRDGLKRAALDQAVRIEKQKALVAEGQSAPPLETLAIDAADYPKLLGVVYGNTELPDKPRNVFGVAKSIPTDEMEARLLASYRVDDEALATLANRRAQAIKEWFAREGGVAPERIFIVKPKLNGDGIKDDGPATRVDFAIR